MNYDDFFIKSISFEDGDNTCEATIYLGLKDNKEKFFYSFSHLFNKELNSYSKILPYSSIKNFKANINKNYSGDEITNLSKHFFNVFLNDIGGVNTILDLKEKTLKAIDELDFNNLKIESKQLGKYLTRFNIYDDNLGLMITFIHDESDNELQDFVIDKKFNGILLTNFLYGFENDKFLTDMFNKLKKTNKFRIHFLLKGKI